MAEKGKKIGLDLFHLFPSRLETKVDRLYGLSFKCMPLINAYNYARCKISIQNGDPKIAAGPSSETGATTSARHSFPRNFFDVSSKSVPM